MRYRLIAPNAVTGRYVHTIHPIGVQYTNDVDEAWTVDESDLDWVREYLPDGPEWIPEAVTQ